MFVSTLLVNRYCSEVNDAYRKLPRTISFLMAFTLTKLSVTRIHKEYTYPYKRTKSHSIYYIYDGCLYFYCRS